MAPQSETKSKPTSAKADSAPSIFLALISALFSDQYWGSKNSRKWQWWKAHSPVKKMLRLLAVKENHAERGMQNRIPRMKVKACKSKNTQSSALRPAPFLLRF